MVLHLKGFLFIRHVALLNWKIKINKWIKTTNLEYQELNDSIKSNNLCKQTRLLQFNLSLKHKDAFSHQEIYESFFSDSVFPGSSPGSFSIVLCMCCMLVLWVALLLFSSRPRGLNPTSVSPAPRWFTLLFSQCLKTCSWANWHIYITHSVYALRQTATLPKVCSRLVPDVPGICSRFPPDPDQDKYSEDG